MFKKIMKKIAILFCSILLLYAMLLLFYVSPYMGPKTVNGITVSEELIVFSFENYKINYCKLLEKATMNDANSIKKLISLRFDAAASYDHGGVIIDLIKLIGEDEFISAVGTLNKEQKSELKSYLWVGMEYGLGLSYNTLENVFPKIYDFLN